MKNEYYTLTEISEELADVLLCGSDEYLYMLSDSLSRVPKYIVDNILWDCKFIVVEPDYKGGYFHKDIIGNKNVIVFPHTITKRSKEKQQETILHEIAHFYYKHQNKGNSYDEECEAWMKVFDWIGYDNKEAKKRTEEKMANRITFIDD